MLMNSHGLEEPENVVGGMHHSQFQFRSSADAYFIPYASTPAADLLTLAGEVYLPHIQALLGAYVHSGERLSGDWGVRFEREGAHWTARPVTSALYVCEPTDDEAPPSLLEFSELSLTAADAKALQRDLMAVMTRYRATQMPGGDIYRLMVGFA